jgi:Calcineurin-like phosphoesterase.
MIYITGDTHGDIRRFNTDSFFEQKEMTKDDYVIVLGDFGMVWDWQGESRYERYWLDWLEGKSFTTLFIDGNHDNHDRLNDMPVEEWHGGKVHKIRPSIFHLMRGQVFDIEGLKVFTFGGASSHDIKDGILEPGDPRIPKWNKDMFKLFRVNKESWWERELPTEEEMEEGLKNLEKVNWTVDFVLTHCTSSSTTALIDEGHYGQDILTKYLQDIKEKLTYKKWFFGHHHMDMEINDKEICLFEQIIRVH